MDVRPYSKFEDKMRHKNLADRSDSCLVVVDMQEPFLRAMFDRERVVNNAKKLVGTANVLGLPILVTLQNPERMGDTVTEIAELLPQHEAIGKMAFSCCGDRAFNERLAKLGKRTVILCGVETHICVSQTAHDLQHKGYTVHVPADAVCSRQESDWQLGLDKMRHSGIVVGCTEGVMYELLGCAGTDEFRQILKLVK